MKMADEKLTNWAGTIWSSGPIEYKKPNRLNDKPRGFTISFEEIHTDDTHIRVFLEYLHEFKKNFPFCGTCRVSADISLIEENINQTVVGNYPEFSYTFSFGEKIVTDIYCPQCGSSNTEYVTRNVKIDELICSSCGHRWIIPRVIQQEPTYEDSSESSIRQKKEM